MFTSVFSLGFVVVLGVVAWGAIIMLFWRARRHGKQTKASVLQLKATRERFAALAAQQGQQAEASPKNTHQSLVLPRDSGRVTLDLHLHRKDVGGGLLQLGGSAAQVVEPLADGAPYRESGRQVLRLERRPELTLHAMTKVERLGQRLGFNRSHGTTDPAFDQRVQISTGADPEAVRALLAPAQVREAALSLVDQGRAVVLHGDSHQVQIQLPHPTPEALEDQALEQSLLLLDRIRSYLPPISSRSNSSWPEPGKHLGNLAMLLLAVGLPLTFMGQRVDDAWRIVDSSRLVAAAFGVGLGLWILALAAMALWLRQRYNAMGHLVKAGLLLLPALPLLTNAAAHQLNVRLSEGASTVHQVVVLDRTINKGSKNKKTYVLRVSSWRGGKDQLLELTRTEYNTLGPDKQGRWPGARVVLRQGWLGYHFVESVARVDRTPAPGGKAADRDHR